MSRQSGEGKTRVEEKFPLKNTSGDRFVAYIGHLINILTNYIMNQSFNMVFLTMQKINLTLITIDLLELIKQEKTSVLI